MLRARHLLILSLLLGCVSLFYAQSSVRFAVIGDYGYAGQAEFDVSNLVKSWNPEFIITTGDNNYPDGADSTIDQNIGQFYHEFIFPYTGGYGQGDTVNRFFPSLGNHDWLTVGATPYISYFVLPGNERYYEFLRGPVHFFALDSDASEPDGNSSSSVQANWLQVNLSASGALWKLVYFHHPPFSSGTVHGSTLVMQWPFRAWGASAVLAGHEHNYERILADSIVYFVNGLGGRSLYPFGTPVAGSEVRYNADYGAMLVDANLDSITFKFINRQGTVIDSYTLPAAPSSVREPSSRVPGYALLQNYPNPFNPMTTIEYILPKSEYVTLRLFDVLGREVLTVHEGYETAGTHRTQVHGQSLPSGVYFYRFQAGKFFQTKKLVLVK